MLYNRYISHTSSYATYQFHFCWLLYCFVCIYAIRLLVKRPKNIKNFHNNHSTFLGALFPDERVALSSALLSVTFSLPSLCHPALRAALGLVVCKKMLSFWPCNIDYDPDSWGQMGFGTHSILVSWDPDISQAERCWMNSIMVQSQTGKEVRRELQVILKSNSSRGKSTVNMLFCNYQIWAIRMEQLTALKLFKEIKVKKSIINSHSVLWNILLQVHPTMDKKARKPL